MPGLRRSTLADVAQRAGVSRTTASYILNGRSEQMRISAGTQQRVLDAVRELDYRPNWSARTLRRSRTQTIGFITDFVAGGAFAGEMLDGASAAARAWDHLLVIGETQGQPDTEHLLVRELIDRQVDGIIYATLAAREVRLTGRLREGGRVVLLNCEDPSYDAPCVLPDDEDAGRKAAEHLLRSGALGPFVVVGDDSDERATAGRRRRKGLAEVLAASGRAIAAELSCDWEVLAAREAVRAHLAASPPPGALVCLNDRIAMGAYQALEMHRLRAGRDVSVISFDGSDLAGWLQPTLTSLELPFREMGRRSVEVLTRSDHRLAGRILLPLELREGASVVSTAGRAVRG